jgi:hypothetical protein
LLLLLFLPLLLLLLLLSLWLLVLFLMQGLHLLFLLQLLFFRQILQLSQLTLPLLLLLQVWCLLLLLLFLLLLAVCFLLLIYCWERCLPGAAPAPLWWGLCCCAAASRLPPLATSANSSDWHAKARTRHEQVKWQVSSCDHPASLKHRLLQDRHCVVLARQSAACILLSTTDLRCIRSACHCCSCKSWFNTPACPAAYLLCLLLLLLLMLLSCLLLHHHR